MTEAEISAMELYQYLKTQTSFDLQQVISEVVVLKDQQIYIPGQKTHAIYEIINGVVKLGSYGNLGQEVTYDVITSPATFGNLKYLNGQFFEFARAVVPSLLRVYQLDFFKKIIVEEPKVSEWFNRNTVRRWSISEARLFNVRSHNNKEKLESVFHDFNKEVIDAQKRRYNLFSLLTMQDLGDLTGMTRQTVSSTLKKIQTGKKLL